MLAQTEGASELGLDEDTQLRDFSRVEKRACILDDLLAEQRDELFCRVRTGVASPVVCSDDYEAEESLGKPGNF